MGGLARQAKYGDLGTPAGRRKGGLRSLSTHRRNKTGFKLLRPLKKPRYSKDLAEFIGIMLGDGHVDRYQSTVTTNSETDYAHVLYVQTLASKLFSLRVGLSMRKTSKACTVVISSRSVCTFLERQGLPRGSKVRDGVSIPAWIRASKVFAQSCIRGLFDTDGSVFCDRHQIKGKEYKNMGIAFTNRNPDILSFFKEVLEQNDLHPTRSTTFTVFLRRAKDIDTYFKVFGSSNPKHQERYRKYGRA